MTTTQTQAPTIPITARNPASEPAQFAVAGPPIIKSARPGWLTRRAQVPSGLILLGFLADLRSEQGEHGITYGTFRPLDVHRIQKEIDRALTLGLFLRGLEYRDRLEWLMPQDEPVRVIKVKVDPDQIGSQQSAETFAALFQKREAAALALCSEWITGQPRPAWVPSWIPA